MKADEARTITAKNLVPEAQEVKPWWQFIDSAIQRAASAGKSSVQLEFAGKDEGNTPTAEILAAVKRALMIDGYSLVEHPAQSGNDPREHAWTEIKW